MAQSLIPGGNVFYQTAKSDSHELGDFLEDQVMELALSMSSRQIGYCIELPSSLLAHLWWEVSDVGE